MLQLRPCGLSSPAKGAEIPASAHPASVTAPLADGPSHSACLSHELNRCPLPQLPAHCQLCPAAQLSSCASPTAARSAQIHPVECQLLLGGTSNGSSGDLQGCRSPFSFSLTMCCLLIWLHWTLISTVLLLNSCCGRHCRLLVVRHADHNAGAEHSTTQHHQPYCVYIA